MRKACGGRRSASGDWNAATVRLCRCSLFTEYYICRVFPETHESPKKNLLAPRRCDSRFMHSAASRYSCNTKWVSVSFDPRRPITSRIHTSRGAKRQQPGNSDVTLAIKYRLVPRYETEGGKVKVILLVMRKNAFWLQYLKWPLGKRVSCSGSTVYLAVAL